MRWVLSTNGCHLTPLSSEEQFAEMGTQQQFRLTLSSSSQAARCIPSAPQMLAVVLPEESWVCLGFK